MKKKTRQQQLINEHERAKINRQWQSFGYYAEARVIQRKYYMPGGAPLWINELIVDRHYIINKDELNKIKGYGKTNIKAL